MNKAKTDILEIKNLHAEVDGKKILKGINLEIRSGEIHAVMGPNGSGKSTLCNVLMGHPKYTVTRGTAKLNGKNVLKLDPDERAKLGLFLGFQHPLEIPGVSLSNFLRLAKNAISETSTPPLEFMKIMKEQAKKLKVDETFISRSVNEGFSGGEKKRAEIIQMAVLEPKIALLDEIDSGLDIDALKTVAQGIKENFKIRQTGILLVTHYQRILNYVIPDFVHIMSNGRIIKSGNIKLAQQLEAHGYEQFVKK